MRRCFSSGFQHIGAHATAATSGSNPETALRLLQLVSGSSENPELPEVMGRNNNKGITVVVVKL